MKVVITENRKMYTIGHLLQSSLESNSSILKSKSNNSLNEIQTSVRYKKYQEIVLYKRIKIEKLSADKLRKLLIRKNTKKPNTIDIGAYIMYAWGNKKPIFISKEDGRIYGKENDNEERSQAIAILKILNLSDLVEKFERYQRHFGRRKRNAGRQSVL